MVLDENFRKMSKSLGNTVDPHVLIEGADAKVDDESLVVSATSKDGKKKKSSAPKSFMPDAIGVDHLRLWVASTEYTGDVSIGKTVLTKIGDSLKKYRLSAKFLLGCVDDLKQADVVPYEKLSPIDQYLMHLLHAYTQQVTEAYESYSFKDVFTAMQLFNTSHLSSLFFDTSKDRLYADARDSITRRQAQTALLHTLIVLVKSMAPIMPHLAEDIYRHVPNELKPFFNFTPSSSSSPSPSAPLASSDSIFMHGWISTPASWSNPSLFAHFSTGRRVRSHVTKLLESLRQEKKLLANFSEAAITIEVDPESGLGKELSTLGCHNLTTIFNTASTELKPLGPSSSTDASDSHSLTTEEVDSNGASTSLTIRFRPAPGMKCPRCWKTSIDVNETQTCCNRCTQVLKSQPA